jgi:hypothetical protein
MTDPQWEAQVEAMARQFEFPPTPEIAEVVRDRIAAPRRAVAWHRVLKVAALGLVVIIIAVLAVPDWRARALDWLRIGAIRVADEAEAPAATVTSLDSVLDLPGRTTLDDARTMVDFPIRLPAALPAPDAVFVQRTPYPLVVIVWLGPDAPPLSLHQIDTRNMVFKGYPGEVEPAEVNGTPAAWLTSPHLLDFLPGDNTLIRRYVESNVLLWEEGDVTYRVEGDFALERAVTIAESLE